MGRVEFQASVFVLTGDLFKSNNKNKGYKQLLETRLELNPEDIESTSKDVILPFQSDYSTYNRLMFGFSLGYLIVFLGAIFSLIDGYFLLSAFLFVMTICGFALLSSFKLQVYKVKLKDGSYIAMVSEVK